MSNKHTVIPTRRSIRWCLTTTMRSPTMHIRRSIARFGTRHVANREGSHAGGINLKISLGTRYRYHTGQKQVARPISIPNLRHSISYIPKMQQWQTRAISHNPMAGLLGRGGINIKILSCIAEGDPTAAKMTILSGAQFLNGSDFKKLSRANLKMA